MEQGFITDYLFDCLFVDTDRPEPVLDLLGVEDPHR